MSAGGSCSCSSRQRSGTELNGKKWSLKRHTWRVLENTILCISRPVFCHQHMYRMYLENRKMPDLYPFSFFESSCIRSRLFLGWHVSVNKLHSEKLCYSHQTNLKTSSSCVIGKRFYQLSFGWSKKAQSLQICTESASRLRRLPHWK